MKDRTAPLAASPPVYLASASLTRRLMLERAGIGCITEAAALDERAIKDAIRADGGTPDDAALALAELKAQKISDRHGGALTIGADQILSCAGRWYDKPDDIATARQHLLALQGQRHQLHTAVAVIKDRRRIWHHNETATLTMRPFSETFLDSYLAEEGDSLLSSVGAYRLEGLGAQLFSAIEGDYFTILGLPLLALLEFLRDHGVLRR